MYLECGLIWHRTCAATGLSRCNTDNIEKANRRNLISGMFNFLMISIIINYSEFVTIIMKINASVSLCEGVHVRRKIIYLCT